MLNTPSTASAVNHRIVTGPNTLPTFSVPKRWAMNTANSTITTIGTIQACSCGATTSRPSTADSTEIAGVITPSPKNSEAPKMPRMPTTYVDREPLRSVRWASVISAMMPPSPSLSARMMMVTYLTVTTIISDQNTSDSRPSTVSWLAISPRSEEHTSELQSLMRISYAVFCLTKKKNTEQKK